MDMLELNMMMEELYLENTCICMQSKAVTSTCDFSAGLDPLVQNVMMEEFRKKISSRAYDLLRKITVVTPPVLPPTLAAKKGKLGRYVGLCVFELACLFV